MKTPHLSLLLLLATAIGSFASETSSPPETPAPAPEAKPESECCEGQTLPVDVITEASIYQLESTWKNSRAEEVPFASLAGNVQILAMGYTTCAYACPRLLADMKAIESKLPETIREQVHFTFVSIDPEHDTPERLAEYRQENELTSNRWTILTGETTFVQELAVVLGVKYRQTTDTDFAHSNVISVLNSSGEIVHRQIGLGTDPTETLSAITDLVAPDAP